VFSCRTVGSSRRRISQEKKRIAQEGASLPIKNQKRERKKSFERGESHHINLLVKWRLREKKKDYATQTRNSHVISFN